MQRLVSTRGFLRTHSGCLRHGWGGENCNSASAGGGKLLVEALTEVTLSLADKEGRQHERIRVERFEKKKGVEFFRS